MGAVAEKEGWPVDIKVGELPPSAGTGLRAVGLPGLGPVAILTTVLPTCTRHFLKLSGCPLWLFKEVTVLV